MSRRNCQNKLSRLPDALCPLNIFNIIISNGIGQKVYNIMIALSNLHEKQKLGRRVCDIDSCRVSLYSEILIVLR